MPTIVSETNYLPEAFAIAKGKSIVVKREHIESLVAYAAGLEDILARKRKAELDAETVDLEPEGAVSQ